MLNSINLPQSLISIILSCISSSSFAILINRKQTEYFEPSRGIKQGDPLSPYLFILGVEFISILIHRQTSIETWKVIKLSNSGPSISHTLFANDVFLFIETTVTNVTSILSVLNSLC